MSLTKVERHVTYHQGKADAYWIALNVLETAKKRLDDDFTIQVTPQDVLMQVWEILTSYHKQDVREVNHPPITRRSSETEA